VSRPFAQPVADKSRKAMTDQSSVRWGILGPGIIAKAFAGALPKVSGSRLSAIASRDPSRPGLAEAFPGARILDGYQALVDDPEVDAIYIATPHSGHAEWVIRAAESGKHVLCEKPIAVSAYEAEAMIQAARKAGTFLGEAFMYRLHPMTQRLVDLVRSGTIGDVRMIRSTIGFPANPDPNGRLRAASLAGGGILDVGCYPVSMSRLIAGAAAGKPFLDPVKVVAAGYIGATGVDEWATAALSFANDIVAQVACTIALRPDNLLRIDGTKGSLEVDTFWFGTGREGGRGEIRLIRDGAAEMIAVEEANWLYAFEIEAANRAIRAGRQEFDPPGMTWADTLGNMRTLDKWRSAIGLEYPMEKAPAVRTKVDGRPLAKPSAPMRRVKLPGVKLEASVIALGGANLETYPQAMILADAFYERGGNVLDSAWLYGNGRCDRLLGEWMDARGVRDDIVLIGKGAHSPLVYPDVIAKQLTQSLERLKTDFIDVYFMHRDNPEVPVGEFVDAMDAEVKAGRIGIYGGSNWTRERMDAAFDYAAKAGKTPPGALSNNFSLAEMVNPVWGGVLAGSDDAWKAWLRKRQIPNFAWSSQARGFFTDRAGPDKLDDPELVNAWYSEKNFARRERAIALAKRIGKQPLHVALAYCMAQDFPVIPLIGPLTLQELEDSLEALDVVLSPEDVRWLENG
jgi:predicted dehydrogenase/aryl-alcohol dehydrogenase-like predicted oxidoreductase